MKLVTRSLSPQESRVVLSLTEQGETAISRQEIIGMLGVSPQAADHVIRSLRRKGWLERASWGRYLLIPPEMGPDALGDCNVLALASRIVDPYYIGYGTAATYYGLTTQHRQVIRLVTPIRVRNRYLHDTSIRIVNPSRRKFFGFAPVDVLGRTVVMSDREKTVIDCIDRPALAGGEGEVATIMGSACFRMNWSTAVDYLTRISSTTLTRRFGWLADHVGARIPDELYSQLRHLSSEDGRAFFGPRIPRSDAIGYQRSWRLTINASNDDLNESAGIAHRHTVNR